MNPHESLLAAIHEEAILCPYDVSWPVAPKVPSNRIMSNELAAAVKQFAVELSLR